MYGKELQGDITSVKKRKLSMMSDIHSVIELYFPEIDLSLDDSKFVVNLTSQFVHFFSTHPSSGILSQVKDDGGLCSLPIDFQQFRIVCGIKEMHAAIDEKPKVVLLCMSAAVHKVLFSTSTCKSMEDFTKVNIRLYNYPESMISLKNLKAAYIGLYLYMEL